MSLFLSNSVTLYSLIILSPPVAPSPAAFTPVKLEHAEQLELGYMPLRDDFEKVHIHGLCYY